MEALCTLDGSLQGRNAQLRAATVIAWRSSGYAGRTSGPDRCDPCRGTVVFGALPVARSATLYSGVKEIT